MKKKTVITTEKHEIWIIRQPSGDAKERDIKSDDAASVPNSLPSTREPNSTVDATIDEEN
jgi:hypothetical protein